MKINVKKLHPDAILPTYGTEFSAGADLYALPGEDIAVAPGETVKIRTGLAMEIPAGYAGFVYARSSLGTKQGLAPANKVGVIDADYRGEVMVMLHNHSAELRTVSGGDRVAQLVVAEVLTPAFSEVEELTETARGMGGFGSTGTK